MTLARCMMLIPASGTGTRMGASLPKQYLALAGRPMLQHVLETCAAAKIVFHTYVVVASTDRWIDSLWAAAPHLHARVSVLHCGGETRQQSVANALAAIRPEIDDTDWVLVHDAARPGLTATLIERLIDAVRDDAVGGLLAMPLADTVKRADAQQRVAATVDRTTLWSAQTPQMFRYALLQRALQHAHETSGAVTDEASAVEALGLQPCLVEGSSCNFKVTLPDDAALATLMLKGNS